MDPQGRMITTATTAATASVSLTPTALAATLGAIAVVSLILLLIMKELASAEVEGGRESKRLRSFVSNLNVPIVPLLIVFVVIVAVKVWEVL